jgi:SAM-dependent methyltransferase
LTVAALFRRLDRALKNFDKKVFMQWTWLPHVPTGRLSWAQEWLRGTFRDPAQHFASRARRECPCCGFEGLFVSAGRNNRELRCPRCKSKPRDRFLALLLTRYGVALTGSRVLHFAPEWVLFNKLKHLPYYVGADIKPRRNGNAILDITAIAAPAGSFDVIICNHVLEHVKQDAMALQECCRVLAHDGIAFFSIPIDMDRHDTWEPPADMPVEEVDRICGRDHKRLHGRDFIGRLRAAGFGVEVAQPPAADGARYRLLPEDVFFICRKLA